MPQPIVVRPFRSGATAGFLAAFVVEFGSLYAVVAAFQRDVHPAVAVLAVVAAAGFTWLVWFATRRKLVITDDALIVYNPMTEKRAYPYRRIEQVSKVIYAADERFDLVSITVDGEPMILAATQRLKKATAYTLPIETYSLIRSRWEQAQASGPEA